MAAPGTSIAGDLSDLLGIEVGLFFRASGSAELEASISSASGQEIGVVRCEQVALRRTDLRAGLSPACGQITPARVPEVIVQPRAGAFPPAGPTAGNSTLKTAP
jgi:hypothetical protein